MAKQSELTRHMSIVGVIFVVSIQLINYANNQNLAHGAQIQVQTNQDHGQFSPTQAINQTADLISLINETLAINNKSLTGSDKVPTKDDWTFEMVEYDLMEFLQDLSARYKMSNRSSPIEEDKESLDGRRFQAPITVESVVTQENVATSASPGLQMLQSSTDGRLEQLPPVASTPGQAKPTKLPELSTSLASGDHELGENSWQYGIFDRFTRPRPISSTTRDPFSNIDPSIRYEVREFNSNECGLRIYEDSSPRDLEKQTPSETEASKELNQRRQRPSLTETIGNKKYQLESVADILNRERDRVDRTDEHLTEWAKSDGKEHSPASFGVAELKSPAGANDKLVPNNEFNLSIRRQWLQQQLESTLQMLGFNASSQSAAEFLNQTSGLNLNMRENMMKKSSKLGKSASVVSGSDVPAGISEQELIARQDELNLEARVIGGSDARLGDSPWSASLQALVSRPGTGGVEYRHYCGGTIISEHYVLTAAHCLDFMVGRESRLFVVIGDINWRMSAGSLHGRRLSVEKIIVHSGYKSTAFGHDIGLIRTKESMRPLKVNGKYIVNSVCLPEKGVEHSGEAELVGWGLFSNRNEMADSLQIVDLPILPRPLCVDLYKRRTGLIQWLIGVELITEKQVCAGTFGRGICQGDSGSALVVNERVSKPAARALRTNIDRHKNSRATIIGVVAFGGIRRCSYQSLPGVYMQASKYLDWILPRVQE